jgi:GT2 family glycosyltransferase
MKKAHINPPDISVCIANYNGGDYVLDCLASVYAQEGDFNLEVLLHDDLSTDNSLYAIRNQFPEAQVLVSEENVGFCVSNNRMAKAARGRYLLLLNNDARLRPGSLRALLEFAESGQQQSVLGLPQHTLTDGTLIDRGYRTDLFLNPEPILTEGTHEVGVATGACLWVPRTVWDAIGGFPEWFGSVAEDIFLCLAARLLGYPVIVLDSPGFDHWIGKNLGGGKVVAQRLVTTSRRRMLSECNKTYVMLICYPAAILAFALPLHALLLCVESFFLTITGTGLRKVRTIYAPIVPALWAHRKSVTELRRRLAGKRRSDARHLFAQTTWIPQKLSMLLRYGKPEVR